MIRIKQELCNGCRLCENFCPFGAIEAKENVMYINAACKVCGLCLHKCPGNAIVKEEAQKVILNKADYSDILVYVEHLEGKIAPVTLELIGKAQEMSKIVSQQVCCIFIGTEKFAYDLDKLLDYGVSKVYAYLQDDLGYFKVDTYTNVFYDCVQECRPSTVLVGATNVGRSLAPRIATRCQTGLTADCTVLEMREDTDLVQIRPAFGGNIMAQIVTTQNRPQFVTVRERVMDAPEKVVPNGIIKKMSVTDQMLKSGIELSNIRKKKPIEGIEFAETLIVAGKPFKRMRDIEMLNELAKLMGGRVGATRPVIEAGLADYNMQIGLSGRSVRPRLIITCGVSGAVQFVAGMKGAEHVFAINTDANAPIMKIADYAVVGDVFEIVPELIKRLGSEG